MMPTGVANAAMEEERLCELVQTSLRNEHLHGRVCDDYEGVWKPITNQNE